MQAPRTIGSRAERAWRDTVRERFIPLELRGLTLTGRDRVRGTDHGAVRVATVRSGPQVVVRGRAELAAGGGGHVFVNLQLAGTCEAEQAGRSIRLRPGDLALFDASTPYRLRFAEPFAQRVLHVPDVLVGGTCDPRGLAGRSLSRAATSMPALRAILATLGELAPDAPAPEVEALARAAFLLADGACPRPGARASVALTRERALAVIAREHADPGLTAASLAERLGCSARHLHAAFSGSGASAARTIMAVRLREAARLLRAHPDAPVAKIGWRCGFADASHFSRRFRAAHGVGPRAWRKRMTRTA